MKESTANKVSNSEGFKKLKDNTERGSFFYKVYALIDPRDNKLFYIGCTKELIYFRVYNHFLGKDDDKRKILIELLDSGLFPIVEIMYEFSDREYAFLVERYITNFVHNFNFKAKLTNKHNVKKYNIIDDADEWC